MDEKKIIEAIKSLREAMGVSQVTFSVRLGKSLSMIQRYERGENIPARDLAVMSAFSREAKRRDLAVLFKTAVLDVVGPEVVSLIREGEIDELAEKEAPGKSSRDKRRLSA